MKTVNEKGTKDGEMSHIGRLPVFVRFRTVGSDTLVLSEERLRLVDFEDKEDLDLAFSECNNGPNGTSSSSSDDITIGSI